MALKPEGISFNPDTRELTVVHSGADAFYTTEEYLRTHLDFLAMRLRISKVQPSPEEIERIISLRQTLKFLVQHPTQGTYLNQDPRTFIQLGILDDPRHSFNRAELEVLSQMDEGTLGGCEFMSRLANLYLTIFNDELQDGPVRTDMDTFFTPPKPSRTRKAR